MALQLGCCKASLSILKRVPGVGSFGHQSPMEEALRAVDQRGDVWVG